MISINRVEKQQIKLARLHWGTATFHKHGCCNEADCKIHPFILVYSPLWDIPLLLCSYRVTKWNNYDRFEESKKWVSTYVILLQFYPSLKHVFRNISIYYLQPWPELTKYG